jgi:isochorismate pyruvate lyase
MAMVPREYCTAGYRALLMRHNIWMDHIKRPEDCASLEEIRAEIDRIDRSIIEMIGQRKGYVMAAAMFKSSREDVAAPERFAAMLQARRGWAAQQGISADMVEKLYREMIGHFIKEERAHWETGSGR